MLCFLLNYFVNSISVFLWTLSLCFLCYLSDLLLQSSGFLMELACFRSVFIGFVPTKPDLLMELFGFLVDLSGFLLQLPGFWSVCMSCISFVWFPHGIVWFPPEVHDFLSVL